MTCEKGHKIVSISSVKGIKRNETKVEEFYAFCKHCHSRVFNDPKITDALESMQAALTHNSSIGAARRMESSGSLR